LEQRGREDFLEGNLLGGFLLLQKHDGGQPIGTYPFKLEKAKAALPTHPKHTPPVLTFVASLRFASQRIVQHTDGEFDQLEQDCEMLDRRIF
jgi:hypothetical protein